MNATMSPGDDNYDLRCNMSRESWQFVGDHTSVVTQVISVVGASLTGMHASLVTLVVNQYCREVFAV